jgi:hypothetical protein
MHRPLTADLRGKRHLIAAEAQATAIAAELIATFRPDDNVLVLAPERLLDHLREELAEASMGLRLYLAGTEAFLGLALQIAFAAGLGAGEIQLQIVGDAGRRVYCVHCQHLQEGVTGALTRCGGCGRRLAVRNHYSFRLAAYQGVSAEAARPSTLPSREAPSA